MNERKAEKMILGYWAIRGLAQPIRLMLEYGGCVYEDKRYKQGPPPSFDRSCWNDVKHTILGKYPFPNLPYLVDGELILTQSNAIIRHLARKLNLYGNNDLEAAAIDLMLEESMDFRNATVRLCYSSEYAQGKEKYLTALKERLKNFSSFLGCKNWFAGTDSVTACDFVIYELLDQNSLMFPGVLEEFPVLDAFVARFAGLEAVSSYLSSDRCIKHPCNNESSYTTQHRIC